MNILVVGNGFDLAHDLPTGYKDFLRFTDVFSSFKTERKNIGTIIPVRDGEEELVKYLIRLFDSASSNVAVKNLIDEIDSLITNNSLLDYFKHINISQGWVDFEGEISKIVRTLDEVRIKLKAELTNGGKRTQLTDIQHKILKPFLGEGTLISSMDPVLRIKEDLLSDLNKLTRCLEIYLDDFIRQIPVKKRLAEIKELDIDTVVSFNYTDTYRNNYLLQSGKDVECDFIHGAADKGNSLQSCNMVIGIDEYLRGTAKDEDNEFIQFKKFFQRIYKGTGCKYIDWLKDKKSITLEDGKSRPNINIFIYGHSLDVTDKDILARLITADYAKTTIFYHSQKALEKYIINLVKVIGEDELIRRTGGSDKSIFFRKTT